MRLRHKVFLVVVLALITLFAVFYGVARQIILVDFLDLETKDVTDNLERTRDTLQNFIDNLHTKSSDWAVWNDSYQFVADQNQNFIDSNLTDQSVLNLQLNFIAFVDLNGRWVHKKAIDLATQKETVFPDDVMQLVTQHHLYFSSQDLEKEWSGILMLGDQALMISIRPILKSNKTGPVRGTLFFGKYLSSAVVSEISQITHLQVNLESHTAPRQASMSNWDEIHKTILQKNFFIHPVHSEIVQGYALVSDIFGNPALILSVDIPRAIYKRGQNTINYLLLALFLTTLMSTTVILIFLEKNFVQRLEQLNKEVGKIEHERHFSGRVRVSGQDELSDLTRSINQMLRALEVAMYESQELNKNLRATQDQLLQSQKMESIGKLASGISHDFNNLLGVITGYSALLVEEFKGNPKVLKKMLAIQKSAERGSVLTRELLGFARKGKYEKVVFNLNQSIQEILTILKSSVSKNITLEVDLEKMLWNTEGDTTQVLQILMNLVINACDAMPQGGTLVLKSENQVCKSSPHLDLPPGEYVHVSITDTGIGIPDDIKAKIFDPFFTTKKVGKGTGLGLSMVYGILKNHNGGIVVDSKSGHGTTMHLYFPRCANNNHPGAINSNIQKEQNRVLPQILIAEDEIFLRDFYQDYFAKHFPETKILFASDGEEAVQVFQTHHTELDLLLLDVVMPKMNGIAAYEKMKEMKPNIKAIFISGYAESAPISMLRTQDGVGFVQKPLEDKKFLQEIETVLAHRGET